MYHNDSHLTRDLSIYVLEIYEVSLIKIISYNYNCEDITVIIFKYK